MSTQAIYPVRVEGQLDPNLSRWMWLIKWLLVLPHYFVLAFLWMAFILMSVIAFFGILFTGHYPRGIFSFNVGVLRWTWRVSYYSYGALGTDRYPPFTLGEVPDYPAKLEVAYPEHLSRGLVLVKWWLLAIPHYLIVGILVGGSWWAWTSDDWQSTGMGLIGLLVTISGVILLITGAYPKAMFDLVLGFNRWVLRVAAYAGLMTDQYPPFRLDQGGSEGAETLTLPPTPSATDSTARAGASSWGAGGVIALIVGVLVAFVGVGLGAAGGIALWADQTQRDSAGFVMSPSETIRTGTHALVAQNVEIGVDGTEWFYPKDVLGDALLRITPVEEGQAIFVGIAPTSEVSRYLDDVSYGKTYGFGGDVDPVQGGSEPSVAPDQAGIWTHSASGAGTQELTWPVESGSWSIVAMNADGSEGVAVSGNVGMEIPALTWIAVGLLIFAGILMLIAGGIILAAINRANRNG